MNNNKFVSRKQKRKQERNDKKSKKDEFYRAKKAGKYPESFVKQGYAKGNYKSQKEYSGQLPGTKKRNEEEIEEDFDFDDEDVTSNSDSFHDDGESRSESPESIHEEDGTRRVVYKKGKSNKPEKTRKEGQEEENVEEKNPSKMKKTPPVLFKDRGSMEYDNTKAKEEIEAMESEVKKLEKSLGIHKDKERLNRFKKQITRENYDSDLLDFLDNITSTVIKEKVNPSEDLADYKASKREKKQKNVNPKEDKVDDHPGPEPVESLEALKSKSKLFAGKKISEIEKLKLDFSKEIIPLLNKAAESNLIIICGQLIEQIDRFEMQAKKAIISSKASGVSISNFNKNIYLYELFSKNCNKLILDQETINMPIIACICSYISILHFKLGNSFMLYYLKTIFNKFDEYNKDPMQNKSNIKNFIFVFILFYLFGNVSSKIYFDVIKYFIDNFNNIYSEMLLILLSYIGIEIRKEDPEYLKEIITLVNWKYNTIKSKINMEKGRVNTPNDKTEKSDSLEIQLKNAIKDDELYSSKIKYIVEMIEDIKNNKYLKFNMKERFGFFTNFVNQQSKAYSFNAITSTEKKGLASKLDISWKQVQNIDLNKFDELETSSKVTDNLFEQDLTNIQIMDDSLISQEKLNKMIKKYKMNTDLKRVIFIAIATSVDYLDAFEKLMRLNLKREQAREIIKITTFLLLQEKAYNPFYTLLLQKLIQCDKDNKYTFHFSIWDQLKIIENYDVKKIHNLARSCAELLFQECIGIPCILSFDFEETGEMAKLFLVLFFEKYFDLSSELKTKVMFAKLVKNDEHHEFAKNLFYFLAKTFSSELDVASRSQEFKNSYEAALKVLKKIL